MEPTTFTKNSGASPGKIKVTDFQPRPPELEFPTDWDHPKPAPIDINVFLDFCAQRLPNLLRRPDFWERRRAERCYAEFDLYAPDKVPVTYPAEFIDDLLRRD